MNNWKIGALLCLGLMVFSCKNKEVHESTETVMVTGDEHAHDHTATVGIELDNGQKWQINKEMMPFLQEGEKMVNDFHGTQLSDYTNLAAELKKVNNQLISSCTMEGKSHDELHKWLNPHLGLVIALKNASDLSTADTLVDQLVDSYREFDTYFQ
jgi:hypothetical protein